ncbi:hypothetical protein P4S72_16330 [Vibrio sp. PP-XX7]
MHEHYSSDIETGKKSPLSPAVIQLDKSFRQHRVLSYEALMSAANHLAWQISAIAASRSHIGIVMGNTPSWVVADIALMLSEQIRSASSIGFFRRTGRIFTLLVSGYSDR